LVATKKKLSLKFSAKIWWSGPFATRQTGDFFPAYPGRIKQNGWYLKSLLSGKPVNNKFLSRKWLDTNKNIFHFQ
jgi:hypothetical protein